MASRSCCVFAHVLSYQSEKWIERSLQSLLDQEGFTVAQNLIVEVTDNASDDSTVSLVQQFALQGIRLYQNKRNLGFSAGHNQAVSRFLQSDAEILLILNPDLVLSNDFLDRMVTEVAQAEKNVGLFTPLLLRWSGGDGEPLVDNPIIDAAGMTLTPDLRHFDRGSGQRFVAAKWKREFVFGGTGACLALTRACVQALSFRGRLYEQDVLEVYPELEENLTERTQLFDEAFFAYREDADLSWRAANLGWKCLFVPEARGFHVRVVLPERRSELPEKLNALGVQNRFLLQWNNLTGTIPLNVFFERNRSSQPCCGPCLPIRRAQLFEEPFSGS